MPSPIGHALAGATIALVADSLHKERQDPRTRAKLLAICVGFAVAPDFDFVYPPSHRMMSHSFVAIVLSVAAAGVIARRVSLTPVWQIALLCGLAYGSHPLLDWLADDTKLPSGVQLLWPFSDTWYISQWRVFRATTLEGFFRPDTILSNALAILQETVLLAPIALGAWSLRRVRLPVDFLQADRTSRDNPSS
jgi:membrane-bound metal-dependent hydrolase YbcI (DUF457 family)